MTEYPVLCSGTQDDWFKLEFCAFRLDEGCTHTYAAMKFGLDKTKAREVAFVLPYPPTSNHFWASNGNRRFRTKEYKEFVDAVCKIVNGVKMERGEYQVEIVQFRSDRRKKVDVSNRIKAVEDALTQAGLWEDDSLVYDMRTYRGDGLVEVPCVRVRVSLLIEGATIQRHMCKYPSPALFNILPKQEKPKNEGSKKKKRSSCGD